MGRRIDLTGQRFGRLVVESFSYVNQHGRTMWNCKCDCGKMKVIEASSLRRGKTQSCGCKQKEIAHKYSLRHGKYSTRLYKIWQGMIKRTENCNCEGYHNYGGRGIAVCDEWKRNFEVFFTWAMSRGYREDLTIDRIDVNGNYCPDNCCWKTQKEQCQNMRKNVRIEYKGENLTLSQWGEELGINYITLWHRIFAYGWTIDKAFETPVRKRKKK